MAGKFRVTMVSDNPPHERTFWGIRFIDGEAVDVPAGIALSSFKDWGWTIEEMPAKHPKAPELTGDVKKDVEAAIATAHLSRKPKRASTKKAAPAEVEAPAEAPHEETVALPPDE